MKGIVKQMRLGIFIFFIFVVFHPCAFSGEVMVHLQKTVDQILDVVKDPNLKSEAKKPERRKILQKMLETQFDYEEMSKRSLGKEWKNITTAQKSEFVSAFQSLLEDAYLTKIEAHTSQTVTYDKEKELGNGKVLIQTTLKSSTIEVPIHYNLYLKKDTWKIYDVNIEGVGLVQNYRSQFTKTLQKDSFDTLLKKLKDKQAESIPIFVE
jgi:phospholipid transport system substrate-binding protein